MARGDMQIGGGGVSAYSDYGCSSPLAAWGVSTFRTLGNTSNSQPLLAILNKSATRRVLVTGVTFMMDSTAALTSTGMGVGLFRTAAGVVGGGTAMQKIPVDSQGVSDVNVTVLGGNASDGGAGTAITGIAVVPPNPFSRVLTSLLHTAVGQRWTGLLPLLGPEPILLRPNEGVGLVINGGPAGSNPVTNFYQVICTGREY